MHHTLPFPAPEMKCVLALADEEGRRGATLQGKAAKGERGGTVTTLLPSSLEPRHCLCVPWGQPSWPSVSTAQEHVG